MEKGKNIKIVSLAIIVLVAFSICIKIAGGHFQTESFENGMDYQVNYHFQFGKGDSDSTYYIKAFVPQNNHRQTITMKGNVANSILSEGGTNKQMLWDGSFKSDRMSVQLRLDVNTRPQRYSIDPTITVMQARDDQSELISATEYIESDHPKIIELSNQLGSGNTQLVDLLNSFHSYVYRIPAQPIKQLTTAVEVLNKNMGSCNGKSRLFVALCRSVDIPARVAGGIILDEETKRTSHLWAEVLINGTWVPFDPLNGHFAYLPANYLEIYKGDEFLVTRSSDMVFDYQYEIASLEQNAGFFQEFNMFHIAGQSGLSSYVLSLLMLLPVGALIVAIFRNVIGLKTFGVFLPVLIAISFLSTGLLFGLVSFVVVILLISLMHYPLHRWGILHVPKLVVMLIGVVFFMIVLLFAGVQFNLVGISGLTFFPIVILTVSAEKYARIVVEEGLVNASKILAQTILVTLFCYIVVSSDSIYLLLMNFPELLLVVAVVAIQLGKWIGLRISEYKRFGWVIS